MEIILIFCQMELRGEIHAGSLVIEKQVRTSARTGNCLKKPKCL